MLPMIAAANLWLFFYTPDIGLLDQILGAFGVSGTNWLGDPDTVMPCLIAMTVWKEAGFFMIFYLAALQTQPPELWEAAHLEGASRCRITSYNVCYTKLLRGCTQSCAHEGLSAETSSSSLLRSFLSRFLDSAPHFRRSSA